jgi:hypothetical protein
MIIEIKRKKEELVLHVRLTREGGGGGGQGAGETEPVSFLLSFFSLLFCFYLFLLSHSFKKKL